MATTCTPFAEPLPTFSYLADNDLKQAIDASIEEYPTTLQAFDHGLPIHFHHKSKAARLEFICATVDVCNVLSTIRLSPRQAAAMMQQIDLLYRVDDLWRLLDAYGVSDTTVAFEALQGCFQAYIGSSTCGSNRSRRGLRGTDVPLEGLATITRPVEFAWDLQDVVERMQLGQLEDGKLPDLSLIARLTVFSRRLMAQHIEESAISNHLLLDRVGCLRSHCQ